MTKMEIMFENPQYLLFLISLPVLIIFHYVTLKRVKGRVLQFANFLAMSRVSTPQIQPRNIMQLTIRLLTLTLIILAVAGMNVRYIGNTAESDYVLAIDVSSSMSTADIEPSRLEAAKEAATEFLESLPEKSKVGLVTFSGTSFVEQKMTDKREEVINKINNIQLSYIGGTDIGEAIISSTNLLMEGSEGKAVILITDGMSNIGVGAAKAVDYANDNNVQVFTIGIGTVEGGSPEGVNISLRMDDELLKNVAELTDGQYIYAKTKEEISEAYAGIIKAKKRKISVNMTVGLMFLALILSFTDWLLVNTKYKRIP